MVIGRTVDGCRDAEQGAFPMVLTIDHKVLTCKNAKEDGKHRVKLGAHPANEDAPHREGRRT